MKHNTIYLKKKTEKPIKSKKAHKTQKKKKQVFFLIKQGFFPALQ